MRNPAYPTREKPHMRQWKTKTSSRVRSFTSPVDRTRSDGILPRRGVTTSDGMDVYRKTLLALRGQLYSEVANMTDASLGTAMAETTSASPDVAELASEAFEQSVALSLLGSATGTLERIEAALHRIERGDFGRCEDCDISIPAARLEAIPYTTLCIDCASARERNTRD